MGQVESSGSNQEDIAQAKPLALQVIVLPAYYQPTPATCPLAAGIGRGESVDLLSNPAVFRLDAGEKHFSTAAKHFSPATDGWLQQKSTFLQRQTAFPQRRAVFSSGKPAGGCAVSLAPAANWLALGQSGLLQRQSTFSLVETVCIVYASNTLETQTTQGRK